MVSLRRALFALTAATLVAALVAAPTTAAGPKRKGDVHKPPYKNGPSGGDEFNHVERDPESGEMFVVRIFPGFSPVVGCEPEPSAGWGMFTVKHTVDSPVGKVTLAYDAALDNYAWMTVGARKENGDWLGVKKIQGPLAGSGKLTAELNSSPPKGESITVEFGLQLGDSCPQVGFAAATFPSVTIK